MKNIDTIVIATGGTGGHMFPAASFAEIILRKNKKITLITDKRGAEFKGIFAKHPIHKIRASSPSGNIFKRIYGLVNLSIGFFQAFSVLGKVKPKMIVAFGGYASSPTVMAALFRRIPVVIHEQNAVLGRANRFSAKFAKLLALSFKETKRLPEKIKTTFVGMPVRADVKTLQNSEYPNLEQYTNFNILVFGGSQGARIFSKVVPEALSMLSSKVRARLNIIQQCRETEIEEVRSIYNKAKIKYQVAPFFDDMGDKIKNSHLLICRGGSSTIAEATVIGRPMIMVPLKASRDGDQAENAKWVQNAGAGWIMNEDKFTPEELKNTIDYLMKNLVFVKEAAYNSSKLGVVNADEKLVEVVLDLLENQGKEA